MADPADLNLDELKRRGRRRLIGAIVLALVAAVVVPMLLESEPRPLGEDVSVRIPPVDDDKFATKLPKAEPAKGAPVPSAPATTTPATATPAPAAPAPETSTAAPKDAAPAAPEAPPRKSLADAEKSVMNPSRPSATSNAKTTEPAKAPAPAPAPAPAKASAEGKAEAAAKTEPPREGYVVQLAAFSDDKGANALASKLKRAGYPAYTEPVSTSRGTLWRVRVGGYPSRETASQSRDRLKGEGHAGIVVPAK